MTTKSPVDLPPELEVAAAEFREWWDAKMATAETAERISRPLYHYTDAAGLQGIIANREMWFTNIFHQNDPSELGHGIKMACAELRAAGVAGGPIVQLFCERMIDGLIRQVGVVFVYFTTSFSRHCDDINQWRVYADNGRGFALGLKPSFFHPTESHGRRPNERYWVGSVVYDEAEAIRRMKEPIGRVLETLNRPLVKQKANNSAIRLAFVNRMCVALGSPIIWNSLTTKNPAYRDEQEVRLMSLGEVESFKPYVKTRTRGSRLVPFIKVDIGGGDKVDNVVIGPAADKKAADALAHLLRSVDIDPAKVITRSAIPHRVH